jgi:O-glycosyl hydrolase
MIIKSAFQMKYSKTQVSKSLFRVTLCVALLLSACGGDDEGDDNPPPGPSAVAITINPATTYQEMLGFGGALSWYSDRVISSTKKTEIANLIFDDLGADIIRLKNWYYPDNYPAVTSTDVMTDDNSKASWNVTNQLYELAKDLNPDVRILFSSWGPPAGLKSNGSTREGTLKKDGDEFMYDAYADYWVNLLDNLPFDPEYISIQNEPTYSNPGWTTCQWSATETTTSPDYHIAFDKVYDKIKDRANAPVMIGPESQDIATFAPFANILKNKAHCGMLAYHPYNINTGTSAEQIVTLLQTIKAFNTKPNIMTEFSDNLNWFNTALFIHNTLVHANSSGYIYWKLAWAAPAAGAADAGMISINAAGAYTVTPFYHLIKHFSKHIDAGYKRIDAATANVNLRVSAFKNAANDKLTVIILNTGSGGVINVDLTATGETINGVSAVQSKEGSYYQAVDVPADNIIPVPAQSITTVVLDI